MGSIQKFISEEILLKCEINFKTEEEPNTHWGGGRNKEYLSQIK